MMSNLSSIVLFTRLAALRRKVIAQNGKFYGRFPGNAEQVRRIVRFLIGQPEGGVRTPSGNLLTPRGLQSLGCQGRQPLTFPTEANGGGRTAGCENLVFSGVNPQLSHQLWSAPCFHTHTYRLGRVLVRAVPAHEIYLFQQVWARMGVWSGCTMCWSASGRGPTRS